MRAMAESGMNMYQKSFVVLPIQFQGQLDIHTPPIGGINKTSGIVLPSNTTVILRKDRGSSETAGFGRDEGSSCRIASRRHRAFLKMLSGGYVRSLDQKRQEGIMQNDAFLLLKTIL